MFGSNDKMNLWVIGGCFVVAVAVLVFMRSSPPVSKDQELGKIDTMELKNDVAGLTGATRHSRNDVAVRAIVALARVGRQNARETFKGLFSDPREDIRAAAASAYYLVGERTDASALAGLLKDKSAMVRGSAAKSLGALRAWDGMPQMIDLLDDPNDMVRADASNAILQIVGAYKDYHLKYLAAKSDAERRFCVQQFHRDLPALKKNYDSTNRPKK